MIVHDIREQYLGTGDLAVYTFDFKIKVAADLLVIVVDDAGDEVERVRGDDTTYLSSVDFDAENGGGTVTLLADLTTDYVIMFMPANDEPNQPYEFKNNGSFTLKRLENALDYIVGALQRAAYLARRSLKMSDLDEIDAFDMTLPPDLASEETGSFPGVNTTRDGWAMYNADDIAAMVTVGGPVTITNGMAATDVLDMTVDRASYSSAKFMCEVKRDTTIHLITDIILVDLGGVWTLHEGLSIGTGDHGLDFSVTEADGIAQVQIADVDASGDGTLKFKRMAFNVA